MTQKHYSFGEWKTTVFFMDSLKDIEKPGKNLYVFDTNTRKLFNPPVKRNNFTLVLPSGEAHKTMESVMKILSYCANEGFGRDDTIIGIGGGVICDMAAFAASLYMRGCRLTLVPTTLLSMVDASFGGKTGVDFYGHKNILGSFYPAEEIWICTTLLFSLPEREYRSGLAEVLKHALLDGPEFFNILKTQKDRIDKREIPLLQDLVMRSIEVKANLVTRDLRESGARAYLNLGHTFGHALESVTSFSGYTHGEAVAWGINAALKTGLLLGLTDPEFAVGAESLLMLYGFDLIAEVPLEALISAMQYDKKKRDGRVRFVLQKRLGETFIHEVSANVLKEVIRSCTR